MATWLTRWTADGSPTLEREADGAVMHSLDGAWTQACLRYAACVWTPESLRRGQRGAPAGPLRLLDIGAGSGLNLAAALAWTVPRGIQLDATCIELDPAGLEAAGDWAGLGPTGSEHSGGGASGGGAGPPGPRLPDWRPWHRMALGLLGLQGTGIAAKAPEGPRASLLAGDGRDILPRMAPGGAFQGVFLDPFAPAQEGALWEPAFVAEVVARMAPGARLSTYSSSLAVRTSLAAAGLRVGRGPRVGGKAQGTLGVRPGGGEPAHPWSDLDSRTGAKLQRRLARNSESIHRAP